MLKKLSSRILHFLSSMLLCIPIGCSQSGPTERPQKLNPAFDERLQNLLSFTIPLISVSELKAEMSTVYILDAREKNEYEVSHIPYARHIGYRNLDETVLTNIPKESKIIIYCSVGYRSEKIGKKLKNKGYSNVFNLYGSLFEWVNHGYPIENAKGNTTHEVHTYNKNWSKWIDHPQVKKIW